MKSNKKKSRVHTIFLPTLPLRDVVVLPYMMIPLFVGRDKSIASLNAAMSKDRKIFLVAQKNPCHDAPTDKDIYSIGTMATILQLLKLPDGTVKVLIEGEYRGKIRQLICAENHLQAEIDPLHGDADTDNSRVIALSRTLKKRFEHYAKLTKKIPTDIIAVISEMEHPSKTTYIVAANIEMSLDNKQKIIEIDALVKRQEFLVKMLETEIQLHEMEKQVRNRVKYQMEKSQREYYLTEQMKAIQHELGSDGENDDLAILQKKINNTPMPEEASKKAKAEFKKLSQMPTISAESTVVRCYIDWILGLPWKKKSRTKYDLQSASQILYKNHYGLDDVKDRILEFLAVQKRTKKNRGSVICFVGPPGVGKTSLGESIADSINRKYIRIALGGMKDEAEIRGHRRTYIGSLPGRIIQKISKAGVKNPLILLDEVDKIGKDMRSDPSAALLEVLDPEQNKHFSDHYLEVEFDLSDVMFICTSNTLEIPEALLDRMEIIRLPGYTEDEKINIAMRHLIPKQSQVNGVLRKELTFTGEAITHLIRFYTKEAGVRNLERELNKVFRKYVKETTFNKDKHSNKTSQVITEDLIEHYCGVKKYRFGIADKKDQIGIITGLAWTRVGGELLNIEAVVVPGKGQIIKTGSLGDVMKESIQAAITVARSKSKFLGFSDNFIADNDIHIHVPEGATPKDGPSAGIGMCTAIISVMTNRYARFDTAMTGEINLRGQVLAVGGLKEKLLAAHRGGIKQVIIPAENEKDLQDIDAKILSDLIVIPVQSIEEVVDIALQPLNDKNKDNPSKMVTIKEKPVSEENRISAH